MGICTLSCYVLIRPQGWIDTTHGHERNLLTVEWVHSAADLPGVTRSRTITDVAIVVGIPRETDPSEARVAMTPTVAERIIKAGLEVTIETGAGRSAGFPDDRYRAVGVDVATDRTAVFSRADVILQIDGYGADPDRAQSDLDLLRNGQVLIGFHAPLTHPEAIRQLADHGVTLLSLELLPRITRAQSMDPLTSLAAVAGYKAVLLAACRLPKMFPLMMTPAGTIPPAHVFILGAGIAGLQAIATAKRLGAKVSAYDVRSAAREQVQSLGADFIEFDLPAEDAEDKGGYAKAMGEEFYRLQREFLTQVLKKSDVVITTAAVPGKKAPILITDAMVSGMAPGSVIVDLAAEGGGNCEPTKAGETLEVHGVWVIGVANPSSSVPHDASQMYAKNIEVFLMHHVEENQLRFDPDDLITKETLVVKEGRIVHPRVADLLGILAGEPKGEEA